MNIQRFALSLAAGAATFAVDQLVLNSGIPSALLGGLLSGAATFVLLPIVAQMEARLKGSSQQ